VEGEITRAPLYGVFQQGLGKGIEFPHGLVPGARSDYQDKQGQQQPVQGPAEHLPVPHQAQILQAEPEQQGRSAGDQAETEE
jgi:hypothetical protein